MPAISKAPKGKMSAKSSKHQQWTDEAKASVAHLLKVFVYYRYFTMCDCKIIVSGNVIDEAR